MHNLEIFTAILTIVVLTAGFIVTAILD